MSIDMTSSTSASSNACEHSALVLLLKKMATKTSNVLGGMIDLPWDGGEIVKSMEDVRIVEDMLDHENEAGLFSEMVLPHLFPMLKALLPPMDGQDKSSPIKNKVGADKLETTSANIVSSIAEDKPTYDGLVLSTSDVIERLDFVITQMDIARIERTASHCLHVENIHQLPTIKYRKSNSDRSDVLICPPCDHVLGHEIEDKKQSHQGQVHDDTQVWSWMMIPRDTSKEVSRIISTNWSDIPESISICSSHNDDDMDPSFDYCVICRAHFREGEMLLTLPCEHLFHSKCVCSNKILGVNLSGCPMCKRTGPKVRLTASSEHSSKNTKQQAKSSCHSSSDGSVPSWAFVKLGSLLSSKGT